MSNANFVIDQPMVVADFTHALCIGETGSGKTTGFVLPNIENRIKLGHGVLVFDYKGNLNHMVKHLAKQNGVLNKVVDIGTPWSRSINPLARMNLNDVEIFIYNMMQGGDTTGHNHFWHQAAARLFLSIFTSQRSLFRIAKELNMPMVIELFQIITNNHVVLKRSVEEFAEPEKSHLRASSSNKPIPSSYKIEIIEPSLYSVAKTVEDVALFISYCASLEKIQDIFIDEILLQGRGDDELVVEVMSEFIDSMEALKIYGKLSVQVDDMASGYYGVLFSLKSTFSGLVGLDYSRSNEIDIVDKLESGLIVIVQSEMLGDDIINLIFENTLKEFAKRAKKPNPKPVSVFLDEASRLVSKNTDLMSDVLRESRVELFLAIQSNAQMIKKLGIVKWEEILMCLTKKYFYRCDMLHSKKEFRQNFSVLPDHVYYDESADKLGYGLPIFMTQEEKIMAEFEFQVHIERLAAFRKDNLGCVAMFNGQSIKNSEILALDILDFDNIRHVRFTSEVKNTKFQTVKNLIEAKKLGCARKVNIDDEISELKKLIYKLKNDILDNGVDSVEDEIREFCSKLSPKALEIVASKSFYHVVNFILNILIATYSAGDKHIPIVGDAKTVFRGILSTLGGKDVPVGEQNIEMIVASTICQNTTLLDELCEYICMENKNCDKQDEECFAKDKMEHFER